MSSITLETPAPRQHAVPAPAGQRLLRYSATAWFITAFAGQVAFVLFILAYYGTRTLAGNFSGWNDKPHIAGYVAGDTAGNLMFAIHVFVGALITLGGLLQLLPQLRRRSPALHRWGGRVYMISAYAMALGGLWLVCVRGSYLSVISAASGCLNAVLILIAATLAWRFAIARQMERHRRWAWRAFLSVSGVWFFRIGIMSWLILNRGPVGMGDRLDGPADIFLQFGSYLVPLAFLELWFAARRNRGTLLPVAASVLLAVSALITAVGVFGTIALLWGPYL